MVTIAIALGLVFGFAFEQLTGVIPGGLVVPGYVALSLDEPLRVGITVAVALAAYGTTRVLESRMILYGRRRATLVILIAFALDWALEAALRQAVPGSTDAVAAIGHLVPGLLANSMIRTGPWYTLLGTLIVAVVVRLLLMVVFGGASPA
jgi:poly-gamma-glutamate biosynthesis protein PgsC/CapC